MWSDAERVMDILKRSRRPLLSFFSSSLSFLTQQLVCPCSRIEASCPPTTLFSCPRPAFGRRHAPFLSVSSSCLRPPPRAIPVCVLVLPSAATARRSCLCPRPAFGRRRAPTLSLTRCPKLCRPGRYTCVLQMHFSADTASPFSCSRFRTSFKILSCLSQVLV